MAAELGQQSVEFSALVRKAAEESFLALKELVDRCKSADQTDSDRKIELLKFIVKTRQRMLRLHVLAKWCQQVPLVQYCRQLSTTLSSHDTCFTQAADSLFFMHEELQQSRAPIYDVPSAIEVLLTGNYVRLPKCIEDLGVNNKFSEKQQKPTLRKLNTILRSKLLEITLPKEISEIKISNGTLALQVDGEFKVLLTLGYRGHLSLWRILHLELLAGDKNGKVKLEDTRRYILGDDLERRMSAAENPFTILYSILHELSVALVMDTVIRQVQVLRLGRWKDAIRFELISDGGSGLGGNAGSAQYSQDGEPDSSNFKTPGLKINYWLNSDRGTGGLDSSSSPFLKIEPGSDLRIKCLHSTFVLDPFSDKGAEFDLDQGCIDVEKLLLKAIACNKHTRLLEMQRELCKNAQIFQNTDDVILHQQAEGTKVDTQKLKVCEYDLEEYLKDEVLRVRSYGSVYFTLGISLRTGRCILQCPKNTLEDSVLADCEENLNQGSVTASEVFIKLRSKSILYLFASIGRFLGLQVYEQGVTKLKIPTSILNGLDLLLMGFPQCGATYYLMIQLDRDFKPLFKLLETQPDTGGGPSTLTDGSHIIRFNDIDISHMELIEDEMNLTLITLEKLNLVSPSVENSFPSSEHALHHSFTMEHSLQNVSYSQSSFSCIVDEVFELERDASAPQVSIQNKSLNSSSHVHINIPSVKVGLSSPRLEGAFPYRHSSNQATNSGSYKGLLSNGAFASSVPLRGCTSSPNLASSKSDQDLTAVKNTKLGEISIVKDDKVSNLDESSRESGCTVSGSASRIISPSQPQGSMTNFKHGSLKISSTGCDGKSLDTEISSLWKTFPMRQQTLSSMFSNSSMQSKIPRKRTLSDILPLISSLEETTHQVNKRRRTSFCCGDSATPEINTAFENGRTKRLTYLNLLADVNHGVAPNVYISSLLHVVRHCSLCIKHARLTSQMDALEIPYVEDVGLRSPSLNLWFRLPFVRDDFWQSICLHLGKPGTMSWDVKVTDPYFKELWELQKGSNSTAWGCGIRIANTCDIDSHIHYDSVGITLSYRSVEHDSIKKLVSDLQRLFNARLFAFGMRKLLIGPDKTRDDDTSNSDTKTKILANGSGATCDKMSEQIGKVFKIEAVGLMSLWFCYGPMPVIAHFVVEWESGKEGCTMHVSPDQLWPHTKFLEDFINGGEVASFLDCVRLTAGPLLSLGGAIRPARVPPPVASVLSPLIKQNSLIQSQGILPNASSSNAIQPSSSGLVASSANSSLGNHSLHSAAMLSAATRGGPGIVPSSLLPIDVSVVMRGPYWIRIIYRKQFSVDMRCYAGDQVWLQPATPPKGGPAAGGSLPCPQFRPFIMEHVAQGLNALETNIAGTLLSGGLLSSGNTSSSTTVQIPNGNRSNIMTNVSASRPASMAASQGAGGLSRVGNAVLVPASLTTTASGLPSRISSGTGVPVHVKGELNTAFIGLGDDGGYGGGWVPLAALKKVLRGILKYLGVLWLFAQLPDLLKDILGSILTNNEGALLNLDQEQPALRFFVGGYVFAVSVHRVQLLLQVLSVKRFHHHQQQQQQQQTQSNTQEELASTEISEICDYFSRRVASEPYDASRVASFITLLTLPISVLREFLKLTAWEKAVAHAQGGDIAPVQRARVELCLENHSIAKSNINHNRAQIEKVEKLPVAKSNIHHDRAHNAVEFSLTFVLDSALIPHVNAAGGAAWLPYCVSVRLKYSFGENAHISLVAIDGSHGGKACWSRLEDWDKCKQRLARAVDFGSGSSASDFTQGRLRLVAENLQRTLQASLQQLKDASVSSISVAT